MNNTASFLDNHITRGSHLCPLARPITRYRRPVTIWEHVHTHRSRLGRGRACTSVRLWEYGWEDLRDSCAVFLVFRVGSARTLMRKDAAPRVGARRTTPHRGGTHTMKVPTQSERPVTEEEEQDFPHPNIAPQEALPSSHSRSTTPMGNRCWAHCASCCGSCWCLHAGREHRPWNDRPSTAATPTVHPAPVPSASSEPPMSGGYEIGPDGVLVRPAEFGADTYTKPELPEEAKENRLFRVECG